MCRRAWLLHWMDNDSGSIYNLVHKFLEKQDIFLFCLFIEFELFGCHKLFETSFTQHCYKAGGGDVFQNYFEQDCSICKELILCGCSKEKFADADARKHLWTILNSVNVAVTVNFPQHNFLGFKLFLSFNCYSYHYSYIIWFINVFHNC